jgi:hypothetical protein
MPNGDGGTKAEAVRAAAAIVQTQTAAAATTPSEDPPTVLIVVFVMTSRIEQFGLTKGDVIR